MGYGVIGLKERYRLQVSDPLHKTPPSFMTRFQLSVKMIISAVSFFFFFPFCSSLCLLFQQVFSDVFEILRLLLPHISWRNVDSDICFVVVVVAEFFLLK